MKTQTQIIHEITFIKEKITTRERKKLVMINNFLFVTISSLKRKTFPLIAIINFSPIGNFFMSNLKLLKSQFVDVYCMFELLFEPPRQKVEILLNSGSRQFIFIVCSPVVISNVLAVK